MAKNLEKTTRRRHKKNRNTSKEEVKEPENCIICFDKVSCRGKLSVCDHWFCFTCIHEWSKNTNSCPVCKETFRCISKIHLLPGKSPVKKVRVPDVDQRVWYDDDDLDNSDFGTSEDSSDFFDSSEDTSHDSDFSDDSDFSHYSDFSDDSDINCEFSDCSFGSNCSLSSSSPTDEVFDGESSIIGSLIFTEDDSEDSRFNSPKKRTKKQNSSSSRNTSRSTTSAKKTTGTSPRQNSRETCSSRQTSSTRKTSSSTQTGSTKLTGFSRRPKSDVMSTRMTGSQAQSSNSTGQTSTSGLWLRATSRRPSAATGRKKRACIRIIQNNQTTSTQSKNTRNKSPGNKVQSSTQSHSSAASSNQSQTVLPKKRKHTPSICGFDNINEESDEETFTFTTRRQMKRKKYLSPEGTLNKEQKGKQRRVLREKNTLYDD